MINYSKAIPITKNGSPFRGADAPSSDKALARSASENAVASSVLTLTQDTTVIEIAAVNGAAAMRWVPTTDTAASVVAIAGATANFDHVISTGTVRRFVVPVESMPATGYGSVQGANRENGLYRRVAIVGGGISSVLLTEY